MTSSSQEPDALQSIFKKYLQHKIDAIYPPDFPPPRIQNMKTLIFDLDDTLIHSTDNPPKSYIDSFRIGEPGFFVLKRPGLDKFMENYSRKFDIFIFTSGDSYYADPIINVICPFVNSQHRLYKKSCSFDNDQIHKDINAFKRPKNEIILVEDNASLKKFHPNNTIIVPKWEGSTKDSVLTRWLPKILDDCEKSNDVRKVIRNISHFK